MSNDRPQSKTEMLEASFYRMNKLLNNGSSDSKRLKAAFRHAAGAAPGSDPELWGWFLSNIEPDLQGTGGEINYAEYALYYALAMSALDGTRNSRQPFAKALYLADIGYRKLTAIGISHDITAIQTPLRMAIRQIISKGQSCDYAGLAKDLYTWQFNKNPVMLKWAREYSALNN